MSAFSTSYGFHHDTSSRRYPQLELFSLMPALPDPTSLIHQVDFSIGTDCISHQFQCSIVLLFQHHRVYSRQPRLRQLLTLVSSRSPIRTRSKTGAVIKPPQRLTLTPEKGGCGSRLLYKQLTFMWMCVLENNMSFIAVLCVEPRVHVEALL